MKSFYNKSTTMRKMRLKHTFSIVYIVKPNSMTFAGNKKNITPLLVLATRSKILSSWKRTSFRSLHFLKRRPSKRMLTHKSWRVTGLPVAVSPPHYSRVFVVFVHLSHFSLSSHHPVRMLSFDQSVRRWS